MAAHDVAITINGTPHRLSLEPRVTLLDLLRDKLALSGTKKGCDHGQCCAMRSSSWRTNTRPARSPMRTARAIVSLGVLLRRGAARIVREVDLAVVIVVATIRALRRGLAVLGVVCLAGAARIVREVDQAIAIVVDAVVTLRLVRVVVVVSAAGGNE